MNPVAASLAVVALVIVATLIGVVWRARTGRVRRTASGSVVTSAALETDAVFGDAATIVQFSTEFCGPCRNAERVLTAVAAERDGVAFVHVDLTSRPQVAHRFAVLQTPTILLLDAAGGIRSRIGGVPRAQEVGARLDQIARGDTEDSAEESHVGSR